MAKLKVKARAVDMLGRQQIAGVPTALHELLKNAHDAYAENVRVDYFPDKNILVIRDDGYGMSLDDYENRWLALGTESKVSANDATKTTWTGPKKLPRRAILGEKGIGRLAIAAIGPQVLVVSRAIHADGPQKAIAGFVNWSIFEQPAIDLSDVDVPVMELGQSLPEPEDIAFLLEFYNNSIDSLKDQLGSSEYKRIKSEIDNFDINITELLAGFDGPDLRSETGGTYFFIKPTNEELDLDLTVADKLGSISTIQKYLLGFTNTMRKGAQVAPVIAEFWVHRGGESKEYIGPHSFFTPTEFDDADHHIEGSFDETGVFRGRVRIYDEVEHEYTLSPPVDFTGHTKCGPFQLNIAYVQGLPSDSRLEEKKWRDLTTKLDEFGGMYIFRDGVRVLPYGNSDYDWLHIEHRRTLSARDWYFSYRRMAGFVEISSESNGQLKEKSGREGFRENRAYRQLRALLENVLQQVAIDFFRGEDAKISTAFSELRAVRQNEAETLKRFSERTKEKRKNYKQELKSTQEKLESGKFHEAASAIMSKFNNGQKSVRSIKNSIEAGKLALQIENEVRQQIEALSKKLSVSKPRGLQPSKIDQKAHLRLDAKTATFRQDVLGPIEVTINEVLDELIENGFIEFSSTDRYLSPVYEKANDSLSLANKLRIQIRKELDELRVQTTERVNELILTYSHELEAVKVDAHKSIQNSSNEDVLVAVRDSALTRLVSIQKSWLAKLEDIYLQIDALDLSGDVDSSHLSVVEALEGQNIELTEKLEKFSEWAQVGMALGVVQHEFSGHSRNLYRGLQKLKPWAKKNEKLTVVFNSLVTSFQHLEGYLQLFLPLDRRMQRTAIDISGNSIEEFVTAIFGDMLAESGIKLQVTSAFRKHKLKSYPSCILPVFINLVDNAIYWLTNSKTSLKVISFDFQDDAIHVSNTGPGIDIADAEDIFEFGYSTKPNGTGIGMSVSRQVLSQIGMDISVANVGVDRAPIFIIRKQK